VNRPAFSFAFLDLGNYQGKQFSGDFEVDGADIEKTPVGCFSLLKKAPFGWFISCKRG
jgi:hypothetical protein